MPDAAVIQPLPGYSFTHDDAQRAWDRWHCNCGPSALAAVLQVNVNDVRKHLVGFEQKHCPGRLTMPDFALCTTASKNVFPEWALLCRSIRFFVSDTVPIYVLWHGEAVENMPPAIYVLDNAPFDLKVVGGDKSRIIATALKHHKRVLYVDCDVIFLGEWKPDFAADGVTFSRHLSNNEGAVGRYNSGFIGASDPIFPDWWNAQPKECPGHYGDQQCLDDWCGTRHEFPEQQNVGFWRWWDAPKYVRPGVREAFPECFRMETRGNQIFYNDAPLLSVHSHLMRLPGYSPGNMPLSCSFNRIVLDCLKKSSDERHQKLYQTIMAAGPNV